MRPIHRVGAESPFGLALPSATPTATQLYGPRGVWLDAKHLVIADTGNHRVLIWHGVPDRPGTPADVVLGQPDFTTEGPNAGGRGPERGLSMPTGVIIHEGRLIVADSWNHRILVWDRVPERSDVAADLVLGQASMDAQQPQRGGAVGPLGLYWPYGVAVVHNWFWVADTGNRRVLGWRGLPAPDQAPAVILGQPDHSSNEENRGGPPSAASFRWPHAIGATRETFFVADAGNHRVLGWQGMPTEDRPADTVLGQPRFDTNEELPHRRQGAHRLRFPYAIAADDQALVVADTANNRVLLWDEVPPFTTGHAAEHVIGQRDFDAAGENRWTRVSDETLCWPYGLCLHASRLAIADSGNNRVMLWDVTRESDCGPPEAKASPGAVAVPVAHVP